MLSVKQRRFAQKYLKHGNATQAAKDAGYSEKTAYSQGQRLLKHVEVQRLLRKTFDEEEITTKEVVRELKRIGLNDPRGFVDRHGNAIPLPQLSAAQAAAITGFEVIKKNAVAGDGHTDTVVKYRLCPKAPILELLCRVLAMFEVVPEEDKRERVPVFNFPPGSKIAVE